MNGSHKLFASLMQCIPKEEKMYDFYSRQIAALRTALETGAKSFTLEKHEMRLEISSMLEETKIRCLGNLEEITIALVSFEEGARFKREFLDRPIEIVELAQKFNNGNLVWVAEMEFEGWEKRQAEKKEKERKKQIENMDNLLPKPPKEVKIRTTGVHVYIDDTWVEIAKFQDWFCNNLEYIAFPPYEPVSRRFSEWHSIHRSAVRNDERTAHKVERTQTAIGALGFGYTPLPSWGQVAEFAKNLRAQHLTNVDFFILMRDYCYPKNSGYITYDHWSENFPPVPLELNGEMPEE